jgi:hypothetical protein
LDFDDLLVYAAAVRDRLARFGEGLERVRGELRAGARLDTSPSPR